MMGSTMGSYTLTGETGVEKDQQPKHQVTLSQPFYMGRNAVTQAQWQAVMGSNPSYFKDCGFSDCAFARVSWNDAKDFINKLNQAHDGFKYRLPSEAEWEYVCRAGVSDDDTFRSNPNEFGMYDMEQGHYEWCADWYHATYEGAPNDGSPWLTGGEMTRRVLRTVGFHSSLRSCVNRDDSEEPGFSGFPGNEVLLPVIPGFRVVATRVR
jgi:formylglycine-generating enzyme required for sulfatase activity